MTALRRVFAAVLGFLAAAGLVQWYMLLTHEPFGADGVDGMPCEVCKQEAYYSSAHWLKDGGMIVLYWCKEHAITEADGFTDCDPGDTPKHGKDLS